MFNLTDLRRAVRHEGGVSRRMFLAYTSALASIPCLGLQAQGRIVRKPSFASDPFTLGVASGDPTDTGVVLWTRLAPKPLEPFGGMPAELIEVRWELASDEGMKQIVQRGTTVATPQLGHAVHIEADGLEPGRWYFYRFRVGEAESPVGQTRTLPAKDTEPAQLRFAFASCQHYEQGLFTAYEQMAKDEPDLVFFLGDYIYEYAGRDNLVRKHLGAEIESLNDYRIRYAQYRVDPLLKGMHAICPWFVTWDDHEFDNNYANTISEEEGVDPAEFLLRRANAYQAYYEIMPLRKLSLPRGPRMQLYRKASFGQLAELMVLDTRQYRSDQPNGDRRSELNDAALNPKASIMGRRQREWLMASLLNSQATWNVMAQQVMMAMAGIGQGEGGLQYSMDQWPGYTHERMRLMEFLAARRVPNPVVLTGDIHSNWVNDLHVDDRKDETPVVASEFVTTSISSGGNGTAKPPYLDLLLAANRGVKFHSAERGYVRCTVTPDEWRSDYVAVEDVTKPGGKVVTRASFMVEAGRPGAKPS